MGNTIGRFGYELQTKHKDAQLPFPPRLYIVLDHWSRDDGAPRVSVDLMSESEVDQYILDLKKDLDAVGKKAKAALKRALEKERSGR